MKARSGRRRLSYRLQRVFENSEAVLGHAIPIRKTVTGIWVPTPLRVVEESLNALEDVGLLPVEAGPRSMVDAGTGDGRLACVLSALKLAPTVFSQALANVRALEASGAVAVGGVRLLEGDHADPQTYTAEHLDFREVGLVFNYPDGNEQRLASLVHPPVATTRVCVC